MKSSKAEADYRQGKGERRCANCSMFRPPHGCTAVSGEIDRDMLCDYFKPVEHGRGEALHRLMGQ